MANRRYDSWPWILILLVSVVGEISVQLVWFRYELSLNTWLLTQFLLLAWVFLAVWRLKRTESRSSSEQSVDLPARSPENGLEQVVNTEDLVGSIVHEIRDPLNRLNMRLRSSDGSTDDIHRDLQELAEIVDRIETVFRGRRPQKRWISAPRLMFRLFSQLNGEAAVRCELELSWIHCAPESLVMVLHNVVKNSLEAYEGESGEVVVTLRRLGPEFCLTVDDKAGGIDPDLARTINREESKQSSGMGLGLMIGQKIMDQHGGRMVVESEQDVGTTVTLTIPIPDDDHWQDGDTE